MSFGMRRVVSFTSIEGRTKMGIVTWVVLGLIAGYFASMFMSASDGGLLQLAMGIGIAGAIVGGFSASFFGMGDLSTFSLYGSLFAAVGAVALLFTSLMLLIVLGDSRR